MNVFEFRDRLIADHSSYIRSFIRIRDERVDALVQAALKAGVLWPDPLIQLNPCFQYAGTVEDLVNDGTLHPECAAVFRAGKDGGPGKSIRLYQHQTDAILEARAGRNYVLTTGTGYGEYRTKRVILEIDDALAEAERTGTPYQTRLDPPPADPRCCHSMEATA